MILCITGSRHFTNYRLFVHIFELYLPFVEKYGKIEKIIEGGAKGVDSMAKRYALENNIPHDSFNADWGKFGKGAGPIRNSEMSKIGDVLFVYHIGGNGSNDIKNKFNSKDKPVIEVKV